MLRLSSKGYGSDLPLIWYSNTSQICILYKSYVNLIGRAKILFFCLFFLAWPPGGTNLLCSHFNDRCSTAVHTFDIFLHPTFARWDENRSRPAWHTSPRHQTQTTTAVIQSSISSLWWINGCNGPPPTPTFPGGWKSALFGDFVPGPDATSGANACDLRWRDWGVHPERGLGWLTCSYCFLPFRLEVGGFRLQKFRFGGSSHRHVGRYFSGQHSKLSILSTKTFKQKTEKQQRRMSSCIFMYPHVSSFVTQARYRVLLHLKEVVEDVEVDGRLIPTKSEVHRSRSLHSLSLVSDHISWKLNTFFVCFSSALCWWMCFKHWSIEVRVRVSPTWPANFAVSKWWPRKSGALV